MANTLNLVDASIDDIQDALSSGALTSVELVARYLRRVALYDCQGLALNSIPVLNEHVFSEAAASDRRRSSGLPVRPLEGIPFTVKDSFKVKGMTLASGSPAFKNLIANEDAFAVAAIKEAGGVLIGRTNMPPMAYGGMQRGIYGRAENPYNPDYLAAAWASGSSNGSAVSTSTSLAAFGMGGETVSSGRSPASNNALVAYTPSRGWISIRGQWPLYPTCDVVVPHARRMKDLLKLLEVVTARDASIRGDFWREQQFVRLEEPWGGAPGHQILSGIGASDSLKGIRMAVPAMYVGGRAPEGATPVFTSPEIQRLWQDAKQHLESLGAEVVLVPDFPVVTGYENPNLLPAGSARLPEDWNWYERGPIVARGWDQFLRDNADANIRDLSSVDEMNIFPHAMRTEAELKHLPAKNAIHWGKLAGYAREAPILETENLGGALRSLEAMRKQLCDEYLAEHNCDCFVFPAQGDVGAANADVDADAAEHAWKNGVWYSNGNRALRHLGVPSVTVPMGIIAGKEVPVGLTFAGRAYDDVQLLRWANAFEKHTGLRTAPTHTPPLESDSIRLGTPAEGPTRPPSLDVQRCEATPTGAGRCLVTVAGSVQTNDSAVDAVVSPIVELAVGGLDVPPWQITVEAGRSGNTFTFRAVTETGQPPDREGREKTMETVARDKIMVVVLAKSTGDGHPAGYLALV